MAAAAKLTRERDFDDISIRELSEEAGCSIGSFYHRFGSKDALFNALISTMLEKRQQGVDETFANTPIGDLPEAMARGALANYREHARLLRTAMRYHLAGKDTWKAITEFGHFVLQRYFKRLEAERGYPLTIEEVSRLEFVFIWLHGHLTTSLAHEYPLHNLKEANFEDETARFFVLAVEHALANSSGEC
ncbi:TetR/AcrR family transcriptional regulator [Altericroceibacterium endophyticum]|uniref:TetR family transcriptional regulator n=1 Tax=Altericroceibacterium endophyticum TaxID=1808508 RepID=A0A6I4T8C8_9SPHN|nr:TetR/AcrR family transcriptional regulator [Altericroceibacterium endophyticum]MXO67186.1 TetR family transcriptional regulator [Altericroceibacterium endophyticum]